MSQTSGSLSTRLRNGSNEHIYVYKSIIDFHISIVLQFMKIE